MDFVEIVIDGRTPVGRDDVEDDLNECLAGMAEVKGAGTWQSGANLDFEVWPGADRASTLNAGFDFLNRLGVGDSARTPCGRRAVVPPERMASSR